MVLTLTDQRALGMSMRVERASLEQVVHLSLVLDLQLEVRNFFLVIFSSRPNFLSCIGSLGHDFCLCSIQLVGIVVEKQST